MSALHITNGDSAATPLRTFLTDPVIITADPLFDGPAPDVPDEEWYVLRGGELADLANGEAISIAGELAESDQTIDRAIARGSDLVLWFEHDLFDQLLLIRTLDRIGRALPPDRQNVFLICIDRFPGIEPFIGLGQLTAAQLESLLPLKKLVTGEQFAAAATAWTAFRSARPEALLALASRNGSSAASALPFLGAALRRLLEEYPSTINGESRSAMHVLRALGDGPLEGGALFGATQRYEERPFMGDWSLFDTVRRLASARVPLVTIAPASTHVDLRGHTVALTDAGREVLAGTKDAVALNGIDIWRGGVHLRGATQSPWRWDAARETLVSLEA